MKLTSSQNEHVNIFSHIFFKKLTIIIFIIASRIFICNNRQYNKRQLQNIS